MGVVHITKAEIDAVLSHHYAIERMRDAAPDLVEALEVFVAYNDMADSDADEVATMLAYANALQAARAALAKARGEGK